ncbi:hypothetical protein ColKHC_05028 [Colletotrichum higginsianum]|nr:hypothetical protein ColKHC_05028 [Colletotrichum higginsianum]
MLARFVKTVLIAKVGLGPRPKISRSKLQQAKMLGPLTTLTGRTRVCLSVTATRNPHACPAVVYFPAFIGVELNTNCHQLAAHLQGRCHLRYIPDLAEPKSVR